MPRFDVFEYADKTVPYVLEVQANLFQDLKTCVVIPLTPEKLAKNEIVEKLKPIIKVAEKPYVLMTTDLAAVPRDTLGKHITNLESEFRQEITEALDFLFQGF